MAKSLICMISDFRREVDENCALLGYYVACSGNLLPAMGKTYWSLVQVSRCSR